MSYRLPDELYEVRTGGAPVAIVGVQQDKKEPFPFDEEEGLMSAFEGWKYPRPQVPDPFALRAADNVKKYIKGWMEFLHHPSISNWLRLFADFGRSETEEFWMIERVRPRMVRELLRVGRICQVNDWIMKTIGVIFEQDFNYRHPFQDVVSLLDKDALNKNPAKEVKRLIYILNDRWHWGGKHWKKKAWVVWMILKLSPKARRFIRQFGKELNLKKMELRKYDLYSCLLTQNYDYLGLSYPERREMHKTL